MSLFNTIIIAIALVAFGSATDAIDSADVGLNANLILTETINTIDCRDGEAFDKGVSTGKSCEDECAASDGSCCVGRAACDRFTGLVRTDGSCKGLYACLGAKVKLVDNSCVGYSSCSSAGKNSAAGIRKIVSSCHGKEACKYAAYKGHIGMIDGSCIGDGACFESGRDGGSIGTIVSSCRGKKACKYAAYGGSIGSIDDSCNNGDYNCIGVAYEGDIGQILSSCSGTEDAPVDKACYHVGRGEFIYDDIDNCCNSVNEVCCQDSTECSDTVTPLQEECTAIASPSPSPSMDFRGFARRFADE